MGGSTSSLLDESKCTYIRGKTEAVIKNFSPHYRRQYAVAFCKHVQDELEQHRDSQSRFLRSKPPMEAGVVLYEAELLHFAEDLKKWKDRYVVIKNDYTVDCFENKEAYQKGASPKYHVIPAGGKVLTSEEDYNLLSDKHFPDPVGSSEKEVTQAFVQLPREFPVYLWQPFARHSYYCFSEPEAQRQFSAVLGDCVRHSNHDFLNQTTYEVEAFLEAIQFFRQEKGHYGMWEMITGNEKEILSNLVMEELLPNLQTMILPKMKGKRNDRKRTWFGIVEETYGLVQQQVSEGLSTLKEECRDFVKTLEGTIRSDMDQILNSKNFLAGKIKATVSEPAQKCCTENIQPFLTSILEELMGPVSSGFTEVRSLFDKEVNEIIQDFQKTNDITKLKENMDQLTNLPFNSVKMEPCYLKVNLLQELLQDLKSRFKVYHIDFVIQRTQNFMQELMENAVYTFEQLFSPSRQADSAKVATTIEKVKLRVLKQYDYDSSTIRKKIFQEALVQITLPTMQKTLASMCKPELQKYEQFIFADYTSMIQVENVYEEILYQTLLEETLKVIKEAAIMKKHNLFEDNLNLPCESVSSLTDLKTPSGSAQTTPAKKPSTTQAEMSDTETQSDETLIVTGRISWEKDHDGRKSSDKEAVAPVKTASDQASKSEVVFHIDIGQTQESLSATLTKQEVVEKKSTLENEDTLKAECVVNTEKELKTQPEAVEEKVASGTETQVKGLGASPKKELKVHEGAVEEKVTSESQMAMDVVFVGATEKESKAREKVSEIKMTSPHDNVAEANILGDAEEQIKVEREITEKLTQSENAVGMGFEEDSKKESNGQEASTETRVISQDKNAGKGGPWDNPEKEGKSEEKSITSLDDVNEIRSLLMVTVEIPADTPTENIKEICEGEILKLQEHNKGNNELSKMAAAEIQVSQMMMNKDAAECAEFKEDRPSSSSLGTDGTNLKDVSKGACNMAQAEWLVESSDMPQGTKAQVEIRQSVWYTGLGSCKSDRLQPEEHTENVSKDKRLDGEEGGVGNSHATAVETESFFHNPAVNADITQVPILDTENARTGLLDTPVSLVLEQGEVSAIEVIEDTEAGEGEWKPGHESSSHMERKSTEVKDIFTEEPREDSYAQQNYEE
ncbi:protein Niban 1 [Melopsittacus undulatus]|uniref:Niban 1/2/3 domain-containing protein n=1 Tax=Melopsittacus undulatus TaxID=13146 RepID=A0A8C6JPM5_MELUD|nr:protein Niban 1 [Melopsittacus undulatus]